jgi:cell division protein FtsA
MNLLYQSQRAMRAKREEAMRRGVIAVLDIGTFKIACLVLRFDETDIEEIPGDGIGAMAGQAGFRSSGRRRPARAV